MSDELLCPNKEICGSCGWSHISYEKQLEQKLGDINGSFALKGLSERIKRIIPSPKIDHYRNRMDFVIDFKGQMGLREKGKWWRVIDNHTCFIADERIENLFQHVRTWTQKANLSFFDRKSGIGFLRYAVIRSTSTGETMVNIVTSTPSDEHEKHSAETALDDLAKTCKATTLLWSINETISDVSHGGQVNIIDGPGYITEIINDITYRITPNAFFQTNLYCAPILQNTVLEYVDQANAKTAIDLYCGSGFFSLPMAKRGIQVHGLELVEDAIHDAHINAELNNLQIDFEVAKIEESAWTQYPADIVIVDPPRVGLHDKVLDAILAKQPNHIVYISCNYKSFAREFVQLKNVYTLTDAVAIDMFPHTPHVELIAYLRKT